MTACVDGESGVPSQSIDCIGGPAVHLTADTNCQSVSKDEPSAITTQQEDKGRSGGPSDNMNVDDNTEYVVKGNTVIITDRISARQLILRCITFCICMYVCMSVTLRNVNYCMRHALVLNGARSYCTIVYVCHMR